MNSTSGVDGMSNTYIMWVPARVNTVHYLLVLLCTDRRIISPNRRVVPRSHGGKAVVTFSLHSGQLDRHDTCGRSKMSSPQVNQGLWYRRLDDVGWTGMICTGVSSINPH